MVEMDFSLNPNYLKVSVQERNTRLLTGQRPKIHKISKHGVTNSVTTAKLLVLNGF